jgi:TatD DNase family protein
MEEYDKDRKPVIARAVAAGISRMLTVGTEEKYFSKVLEIVESNAEVYGALGIHPHNASEYSDIVVEKLRACLSHPKIVGCGEIGLDFFRNYSPRAAQVEAFRKQIELGREAGLPIIIHSRNAENETLEIMRDSRLQGPKTIVHCYSYGIETAKHLIDMGCCLSIPGTITYGNVQLAEVVRAAPLDNLLSETDAPFLTPVPKRGKRNEPAMVRLVVEEIARIKQKTVEETASVLWNNFSRIFLTG